MVVDKFVEGFLTDAAGNWHKLSQGAFDSFGMQHQGKYDPDFKSLLKGSFSDGVKQILGKAGVSAAQLETFGTSSWTDMLRTAVSTAGSEAAGFAAGAMIGGPLGAVFGLGMEGGQILHKLEQRAGHFDPDVSYATGQWIVIDNGQTVLTKQFRNVLEKAWNTKRRLGGVVLGEDLPDVHEGESMEFKDSVSIGFVIGPGESQETLQVFNLLKGRDENVKRTLIKPLTKEHAETLDNNSVWSEVRLLRFEESTMGEYLDSDVNTDPGSEVYRDGVSFLVVKSNGVSVLIESETGAQHWVTVSDLTPGRRTHSTSWNYQEGKVEGSFNGGEKAALAQGDWIWLKPPKYIGDEVAAVSRALVCIRELDRRYVVGFYAIDGSPITVSDRDPTLRPVSDRFGEYLNSSQDFSIFKDAVIRNHDVERLAAGKHAANTLLCLGITPGDDATENKDWLVDLHKKYHQDSQKQMQSVRFAQSLKQEHVDVVGDQGYKDAIDTTEEAKRQGGAISLNAADDENPIDTPGESSGTGAMAMIGLAGAGALMFFMS